MKKRICALITIICLLFSIIPLKKADAATALPFSATVTSSGSLYTVTIKTNTSFSYYKFRLTLTLPTGATCKSVVAGKDVPNGFLGAPDHTNPNDVESLRLKSSTTGYYQITGSSIRNSNHTASANKELCVFTIDMSTSTGNISNTVITATTAENKDGSALSWQGASITLGSSQQETPKPQSITMSPQSLAFSCKEINSSKKITATVLPTDADNKTVTWSSNNTLVATVDSNGNVTAKKAGNATITATSNSVSSVKATTTVTVSHATLTHHPSTATCQSSGLQEYWDCPDCGQKFADAGGTTEIAYAATVGKTSHKNIKTIAYNPSTCKVHGNSLYYQCNDCKKYFSDSAATNEIALSSTVLPLAEHQYEWKTITAATTTQTGLEQEVCKVCNGTGQTRVIPALGAYLLGDVNIDGSVDISDLTRLARHVAQIEELTTDVQKANADTDRSGSVDISDLTRLARHVAQIEPLS